MKKITALVLSLVMALSLCTVAFGATIEAHPYTKDGGIDNAPDQAISVEKVNAKQFAAGDGWVQYYVAKDGTVYLPCTKSDEDVSVAIYTNHGFTTWAKKGDKADASYDFTVTEQKATKEKASCKNAHYLEDGYLDTDGVFYLKDAQGDTQVKFNDIVIKVSEAKLYSDYIPASHILGVPTKNEKTGWEEAKCMVCGAVFACTNDEAVLTKNSIKIKDTVSYNSYAADCVYRDNDHNFAWGEQYADSYAYTWQLKAGSNSSNGSGSSNTGKPVASPKTFDAGIAAYVGLSLLSVAGGAVVIGKKKEF